MRAELAATSAVPQAKYENAKRASERFTEVWNSSQDRKSILSFMLRRIASSVESLFLENHSSGVKDAVQNVTGALFGGFEGAASMAQMGVQKADMQYRTVRIIADNLYQLAQEIDAIDTDQDPDLIEQAKDAALRVRKEGFGESFRNISLLLVAVDNLVSYAYGFDAESVAGLNILEQTRENAFKTYWNENCVRVSVSKYEYSGKQHYRRLFHSV